MLNLKEGVKKIKDLLAVIKNKVSGNNKKNLQEKKITEEGGVKKVFNTGTVLKKVQIGFIIVILIMLVSSGLIFFSTSQISNQADKLMGKAVPATKANANLSADIMDNLAKMYRAQAGLGSYRVREHGMVASNINELKKHVENKEAFKQLNKLEELNIKLKDKYRAFNQAKEGSYQRRSIASEITDIASDMRILNAKISRYGWDKMEGSVKEVSKIVTSMQERILLLTLVSLILGIVLGVLITKGVNTITSMIKEKTFQATEKSETITEMANEIKQIADDIENELTHAFNSIKGLMDGNQEVAKAVEEVTVAIQDVSSGVEDLAKQAEQISEIGNTTYQAVQDTVGKIDQGNKLVDKAVTRMKKLQKSIGDIGNISNRIMQITDQTNLLALNAAIEAARASSTTEGSGTRRGEHGQGFTVVAEEIKDLADESKEATQEVQEIVQEVTEAAEETVEVMVAEEEADTDNIVGVFNEIDDLSTEVLERMEDVREAADNQVAATEEVSALAQQISASSQEVSAQTEETLSATEEMKNVVEKVTTANSDLYFKVDEQVESCTEQENLMSEVIEANKRLKNQ